MKISKMVFYNKPEQFRFSSAMYSKNEKSELSMTGSSIESSKIYGSKGWYCWGGAKNTYYKLSDADFQSVAAFVGSHIKSPSMTLTEPRKELWCEDELTQPAVYIIELLNEGEYYFESYAVNEACASNKDVLYMNRLLRTN